MANVFELYFNPLKNQKKFGIFGNTIPQKEKLFFETFCFLPKTFFEKKQGHLYIVAEAKNSFSDNQTPLGGKSLTGQAVINRLAEILKKYFYQKPVFYSHDSFQLGLNQMNDFLNQEILQNDRSFLSGFHFASIVVGPKGNIKVSKVGNIKIILLRNSEAFDIGSNFTIERITDKIFPDVIEGSLQKNDRILMATPEVFQSFQAEKIIEELSLCHNPKLVKQVFKQRKKIVREFSGACLLAFVKKHPIISFLSRFLK
ncbi:MAG: hypothetical protein PHY72_04245 [Candidatus Pacebacteria bacterium]|nr:hypothetical protein [Candidatus Paceibacterota bacterium]